MTYEESRNVLLSLRMSMCKTEKESVDCLLDYIEKLKKDVKKARKEKKRWKRKYTNLKSYSYITEEEYDATAKEFKL